MVALGAHSLEDRDGESGSLSSTGLCLSDAVSSSDDGHNSSLLDGRRSLETVSVDTSEEVALQLHVVKADSLDPLSRLIVSSNSLVDDLVPVGLDDISVEFEIGSLAGGLGARE